MRIKIEIKFEKGIPEARIINEKTNELVSSFYGSDLTSWLYQYKIHQIYEIEHIINTILDDIINKKDLTWINSSFH